jgi:hypothetical protein
MERYGRSAALPRTATQRKRVSFALFLRLLRGSAPGSQISTSYFSEATGRNEDNRDAGREAFPPGRF